MPVAQDIDFGCRLNFEVDDVRCAAVSTSTKVEDGRVGAEVSEEAFDAPVPTWSGIGASHEVGEQAVLAEFAFYA